MAELSSDEDSGLTSENTGHVPEEGILFIFITKVISFFVLFVNNKRFSVFLYRFVCSFYKIL